MIPTHLIKNQNKFIILKRLYSTNVLKPTSIICLTNNNNKNINYKINNNNIKRFYSSSNEPNKNSKDNEENELEKNKNENEKKRQQAVEEQSYEHEEEDEYDESEEEEINNKYLMPLGTDKSELIYENDEDDNPDYRMLELIAKNKLYKGGYGLTANLSLLEYLHRYPPIRDTPMVPPYFLCAPLVNELFQYNPFLLISPHPRISGFAEDFRWNSSVLSDPKKPLFPGLDLNLDKDDFLKNSANALKTIYQLAKEGNSIELQELSCQPATINLLLLRDSFYAIKSDNGDQFKFNANDIDIDDFEFKPINAISLDVEKDFDPSKPIKIEAYYLVISEKYNINQKHCPVTIKACWVSPVDFFDWKIFDISYKTPFDSK
ncbi:hypothetical protein ACTFIV_001470 [Dictyostelium citrinum]